MEGNNIYALKPLISVIIPTYNRKTIIKDALDSVFAQEPKNFEVIVVDDGSTDGTCQYLTELNLPIRLFKKKNGGASSARNFGLKKARGKYISFLDSDDVWLPDILKLESEYLEKHPSAPLVYSDYYTQIDGHILKNTMFERSTRSESQMKSYKLPPFGANQALAHLSSTMIRKQILEDIGVFDERIKIYEDHDLFNRISERKKLHYINKPQAIYRIEKNPNRLTNSDISILLSDVERYMEIYEKRNKNFQTRKIEKAIEKSHRLINQLKFVNRLYKEQKISKRRIDSISVYNVYRRLAKNKYTIKLGGFIIKILFEKTSDSKLESSSKWIFLSFLGPFIIGNKKVEKITIEVLDRSVFGNRFPKRENFIFDSRKSTIIMPYTSDPNKINYVLAQMLSILLKENDGFVLNAIVIKKQGKACFILPESKRIQSKIDDLLKSSSLILSSYLCIIRKIRGEYFFFQYPFLEKGGLILKTYKKYRIQKILIVQNSSKNSLRKINKKEYGISKLLKHLFFKDKKYFKSIIEFSSHFENFSTLNIKDESNILKLLRAKKSVPPIL